MNLRSVLTIYNLLLPAGIVLTAPAYLIKMFRRGNYGRDFFQRFGFYSEPARAALKGESVRPVWVQAVSVGEVLVALKFIQALRMRFPDQPVVLSWYHVHGPRTRPRPEQCPLPRPLSPPGPALGCRCRISTRSSQIPRARRGGALAQSPRPRSS